jgi:hypothetical protein
VLLAMCARSNWSSTGDSSPGHCWTHRTR